ncbi:hypothetical protein JZ751_007024 [Albula glossodonta]|uniref:Ig-like domain-containing protein n=1 Tax=Albula glossodonta TaxID=121402 RepID=A0A8T2P4H0_9TELE|nr:hypothetical protein JZ751_007024 [Albula glossodonta]
MDWSCYFLLFVCKTQYVVSAKDSEATIHGSLGTHVLFPNISADMKNISDVTLRKNSIYLFKWKKKQVNQSYEDRLTCFENKTLKLDALEERDAGRYEVEWFDMEGRSVQKAVINVILTFPRPVIKYTCQPDGKAQYSCSVNSAIQTLWILNGTSLEESVLDKNELVLDSFTGELFCALKENLEQNVSVTFTCTVLAVPAEVLQTPEVTDLDEFPPPPPSVLEEAYCNDVNKPQGMSTFV